MKNLPLNDYTDNLGEDKNMKYSVSNQELQVILGGLLGDSHIRQKYYKGKPCNAHVICKHGPKQESYLRWKASLLSDLLTNSKVRKTSVGQFEFSTKSLPKLNPIARLVGKPKKVTRKWLNLLDPLGLAVWYMDDGSLGIEYYKRNDGTYGIRRRRIVFSTECFSWKEHRLIQRYFKVVWGIDTSIHTIKKTQYRLYMNYTNAKKFVDIVKDCIHTSMLYKIDFNRPKVVSDNADHSNKSEDIV